MADLALAVRATTLAVAQHDDAVGAALDLVEPVRDEDDADAVRLEPAIPQQPLGLGAVRLEVGSSMMTRRALSDSALAISTSCIWASDRSATGVSGAKSAPSWSSSGCARRRERSRRRPAAAKPAVQRLAADEDIGGDVEIVEEVEFLVDEGDAGAHRSADGERARRSIAVELDRAAIGATTPPRIFISVDLPAPFSPTRPMTSPGRDREARRRRAPRRRDMSCKSGQLRNGCWHQRTMPAELGADVTGANQQAGRAEEAGRLLGFRGFSRRCAPSARPRMHRHSPCR